MSPRRIRPRRRCAEVLLGALVSLLIACGAEAPEGPTQLDLGAETEPGAPGRPAPDGPMAATPAAGAPGAPADPPAPEDAEPSVAAARSAENLAATTLAVLAEAFEALALDLARKPPLAQAKTAWARVKERAEPQFREVARQVERLDDEQRAAFRRLVLEGRAAAVQDAFATIHRAVERYAEADADFARELANAQDLMEVAFRTER